MKAKTKSHALQKNPQKQGRILEGGGIYTPVQPSPEYLFVSWVIQMVPSKDVLYARLCLQRFKVASQNTFCPLKCLPFSA